MRGRREEARGERSGVVRDEGDFLGLVEAKGVWTRCAPIRLAHDRLTRKTPTRLTMNGLREGLTGA